MGADRVLSTIIAQLRIDSVLAVLVPRVTRVGGFIAAPIPAARLSIDREVFEEVPGERAEVRNVR